MRDFEDSTLWRVSAFERVRNETGESGFARLEGPTLLPSTLMADLDRLESEQQGDDVLEVVASCVRHRESALLYVQHEGLVWPVTVFALQMIYHCPRDMSQASLNGMPQVRLLGVEPPGVRPPGHWMFERVAHSEHYRPLAPLLWRLALHGPRHTLLGEIGGTAAYRASRNPASDGLIAPGALGSAVERLRRESVSLREIASWPGVSVERGSRLLNGLYLIGALLITRSHPAARTEPGLARRLLGLGKGRRERS